MDSEDQDIDPRRRQLVLSALAAGAFAVRPGPDARAASRSVHRLRGAVSVNGVPLGPDGEIGAGDLVETGADGMVIFSVARDAFILRRNARLQLSPAPADSGIVEGLRVFTGALLSVFGSRRHRITTGVATIGIRGTGVYVEVEPDRDYVCTCYGVTELAANADAASRETVTAGQHTPRYVLRDGPAGERIREAPFKNHTDAELMLIESLVGRVPEFSGDYEGYDRPRRRRY
ncbi:MAG: hypothetical protein ACU85V_03565 [Gammaproteobacteria bacterium]